MPGARFFFLTSHRLAMANRLQEMHAADAAEIICDLGHTVTWAGTEYDCLVSEPSVTLDLEEGGMMPSGDFEVRIPRVQFGTGATPQDGQVATFEDNRYIIKRGAVSRRNDAYIRLTLSTNL
jgi:hypothetical protein